MSGSLISVWPANGPGRGTFVICRWKAPKPPTPEICSSFASVSRLLWCSCSPGWLPLFFAASTILSSNYNLKASRFWLTLHFFQFSPLSFTRKWRNVLNVDRLKINVFLYFSYLCAWNKKYLAFFAKSTYEHLHWRKQWSIFFYAFLCF